jgi:hypothetical protein
LGYSLAVQAAPVWAFSQPSYYPRPALLGGGGGRWFTGSAADGFSCRVCHSGGQSWPMHLSGLPELGYVPGQTYDIRVTWPEFTEHAELIKQAPQTPTAMGMEHAGPDMSILVELSTANGVTAGAFDMNYTDIAQPSRSDEWCQHLEGVPASQLFDTKATAPDQPVIRCDPQSPDQRCLLAVQVCGAQTLRFWWTAPSTDVGPVWFNAGLVATDQLSADPTQDGVTEVAQPIFPAASAGSRYVQVIDQGCSVLDLKPRSRRWPLGWLAWFSTCAVLQRQARAATRNRKGAR